MWICPSKNYPFALEIQNQHKIWYQYPPWKNLYDYHTWGAGVLVAALNILFIYYVNILYWSSLHQPASNTKSNCEWDCIRTIQDVKKVFAPICLSSFKSSTPPPSVLGCACTSIAQNTGRHQLGTWGPLFFMDIIHVRLWSSVYENFFALQFFFQIIKVSKVYIWTVWWGLWRRRRSNFWCWWDRYPWRWKRRHSCRWYCRTISLRLFQNVHIVWIKGKWNGSGPLRER